MSSSPTKSSPHLSHHPLATTGMGGPPILLIEIFLILSQCGSERIQLAFLGLLELRLLRLLSGLPEILFIRVLVWTRYKVLMLERPGRISDIADGSQIRTTLWALSCLETAT